MIDDKQLEIINFLQDYGCAKIRQLQIIFDAPNDNFNKLLRTRFISRKEDIFVHNNSKIDEDIIAALEIFCIYKNENRVTGIDALRNPMYPVTLSFFDRDSNRYDVIVANKTNENGIVKKINSLSFIPKADKYIFMFKDDMQITNIKFEKPYIYCTYPEINILKQTSNT